jgi:hypothetical protein
VDTLAEASAARVLDRERDCLTVHVGGPDLGAACRPPTDELRRATDEVLRGAGRGVITRPRQKRDVVEPDLV